MEKQHLKSVEELASLVMGQIVASPCGDAYG